MYIAITAINVQNHFKQINDLPSCCFQRREPAQSPSLLPHFSYFFLLVLDGNFLETFNNRQDYPNLDFLPNFLRNFSNGLRENFVIEIDAEDLEETEQSDHEESTSHTRFSVDEEDEDSSHGTFSVSDFLKRLLTGLEILLLLGLQQMPQNEDAFEEWLTQISIQQMHNLLLQKLRNFGGH